jgi:hypothetical protein
MDRYKRCTFLRESVIVKAHKAVVSWEWQMDTTYKVAGVNSVCVCVLYVEHTV